uniref:ABC transporter domain-containing protein n=1 Tax=Panagrellus redivivus TaxID=6233 RepID=A0A7E5A182_PANRE
MRRNNGARMSSFKSQRDSSRSDRLNTAEELTTIVPDMPDIEESTGKTPKVLIWKNLFVTVPIINKQSFKEKIQFWKKTDKTMQRREVLHGVSGVAEPGEILAIMGESGAGKTTLMNVLTQRNLKTLEVDGEITVNGEDLTKQELQRMSSYVQQTDIFMNNVTVKEHLMFNARLRMGRRYSAAQKKARVEEVVQQMNLVGCQDTMIGQRFEKSISLGEKKRLAFAIEILTDPSILFCDEPTSGLDAFMAKQVLKALRDLAEQGKTIILTIHQPSSQVFDQFHKLCLMALGQIVYLGPAKKTVNCFRTAGFPMPGRDNPAEFTIEMLALSDFESEEDRRERVNLIKQTYEDSNMAAMYQDRIYGPTSERRKKFGNKDVRSGSKYAARWCVQLLWLTVRAFRATLRDPLLLKVRLVQTVLTALVVGLMNFQLGLNNNTIMSYNGFLFASVRDSQFIFLFPCVIVFTDEMPVFLRESHGNIYRTDTYFIGKNIAELPQYLILPAIYASIIYGMSGLMRTFHQWVFFTLNCVTITNLATSIGYAAACVFGTNELAVQYLPLFTIPMLVFGGFFANLKTLPWYFVPFEYISWIRYGYETNMINMWKDMGDIKGCDDKVACPFGSNGTQILDEAAFYHHTYGRIAINFGYLLCLGLAFRMVALFALFLRARLNR